MKYLLIVSLLLILTTSCETKESLQEDIKILKTEKNQYESGIKSLKSSSYLLKKEIKELEEKCKILNIKSTGNKPSYILTLHLKQSRVSLSIKSHIKDAANAIDFQLPVSEEFYNSVKIGTNVVDNFRYGSLILKSSFSSWNMTVVNKQIK